MATILEFRPRECVFTDAELTELALAADPDAPLDPDAAPLPAATFGELLPEWYMPAPIARTRKRWHRAVVALIIVAFLIINALGFCITYGVLSPA